MCAALEMAICFDGPTDRPINQPTTDKASYRDVRMHLEIDTKSLSSVLVIVIRIVYMKKKNVYPEKNDKKSGG